MALSQYDGTVGSMLERESMASAPLSMGMVMAWESYRHCFWIRSMGKACLETSL
ncbi:hypothetical protein [Prevotella dentasini]|uniref:hypothetical protein n=1 Tax=Prevotella dentasini TaxID=589537 RepID=UPI00131F2A2A|nr:hypothetical protein [Prevotella dentasini]